MPVFAHGMFGLGLGAATIVDTRSPRVRYSWLGVTVLLAYLPDLAEWVARTAGWSMTHSAPASIPVVALSCVVTWVLIRWLGRERSPMILAASALAITSHLLLDLLDGGIPLWWPFSDANVGPNWFQIGSAGRLAVETVKFGPLMVAGLLIWMWRSAKTVRASQLSLGFSFLLLSIIGSWVKSPAWIMASVLGLGLIGVIICRPAFNWRHVWQAVPVLPVLLVAGVHFYIDKESTMGENHFLRNRYAEALPHFIRSSRFVTTAGESPLFLSRIAFCHRNLGNEREAYRLFQQGIEKFPHYTVFYYGMADLFLSAQDPDLRRPQEVFHLAELMLIKNPGGPDHQWEAQSAAKLIERAKRAVDQQQSHLNAATSNAASG